MKLCQPIIVSREKAEGDFSDQLRGWKSRICSWYICNETDSVPSFIGPLSYLCSSSMSPKNKQAFTAQIPGFFVPCQAAGVCKFHRAPGSPGHVCFRPADWLAQAAYLKQPPECGERLCHLSLHPVSTHHCWECCDEMLP